MTASPAPRTLPAAGAATAAAAGAPRPAGPRWRSPPTALAADDGGRSHRPGAMGARRMAPTMVADARGRRHCRSPASTLAAAGDGQPRAAVAHACSSRSSPPGCRPDAAGARSAAAGARGPRLPFSYPNAEIAPQRILGGRCAPVGPGLPGRDASTTALVHPMSVFGCAGRDGAAGRCIAMGAAADPADEARGRGPRTRRVRHDRDDRDSSAVRATTRPSDTKNRRRRSRRSSETIRAGTGRVQPLPAPPLPATPRPPTPGLRRRRPCRAAPPAPAHDGATGRRRRPPRTPPPATTATATTTPTTGACRARRRPPGHASDAPRGRPPGSRSPRRRPSARPAPAAPRARASAPAPRSEPPRPKQGRRSTSTSAWPGSDAPVEVGAAHRRPPKPRRAGPRHRRPSRPEGDGAVISSKNFSGAALAINSSLARLRQVTTTRDLKTIRRDLRPARQGVRESAHGARHQGRGRRRFQALRRRDQTMTARSAAPTSPSCAKPARRRRAAGRPPISYMAAKSYEQAFGRAVACRRSRWAGNEREPPGCALEPRRHPPHDLAERRAQRSWRPIPKPPKQRRRGRCSASSRPKSPALRAGAEADQRPMSRPPITRSRPLETRTAWSMCAFGRRRAGEVISFDLLADRRDHPRS